MGYVRLQGFPNLEAEVLNLFRPKPEKPITEMDEQELERVIAQCNKQTQAITAKREKERQRTTIGFATGFKALGMLAGIVLLTGLTGSFLIGFIAAVGVTGALIHRSVKNELETDARLEMQGQVARSAMGYYDNMRHNPSFKERVLNAIAGDFNAGAKERVRVSKPLTLCRKKPGLFR
jgi:hypothetical protein